MLRARVAAECRFSRFVLVALPASTRPPAVALALAAVAVRNRFPRPSPSPTPTPGPPFGNMSWRAIGPAAAGGRVAAVAGSATNPKLYYVGAAGGGVWKSDNGGQTWDPVFDKEGIAAIGAVTIDPTDDRHVWVGTGEANPRNDVSYGDGVYKTHRRRRYVDQRRPERHEVHLAHPRRSAQPQPRRRRRARRRIQRQPGARRLRYRRRRERPGSRRSTSDPRAAHPTSRWTRRIPSVIYAGIWKFQRRPWTFVSGGAEDGLYKSTDGGATWTKLEGHGLPAGSDGTHRPGGRAERRQPRLRGDRIERRRALALRRRAAPTGRWSATTRWSTRARSTSRTSRSTRRIPTASTRFPFKSMLSTDGGKTFKAIAGQPCTRTFTRSGSRRTIRRASFSATTAAYVLTLDGGENWFFSAKHADRPGLSRRAWHR